MAFNAARAEIRFGCGLSPNHGLAGSADEMLARLTEPDKVRGAYPLPDLDGVLLNHKALRAARRQSKVAESKSDKEKAARALRQVRRDIRGNSFNWLRQVLARRTFTHDGFRERLAGFWADHFTAFAQARALRYAQVLYADRAVRPHIAGRFPDMLRAVVTHPMMLNYLDQSKSRGPNSAGAKKKPGKSGLNENLARELMELHTLGVGGPYTQTDVRQMALLLTGLTHNKDWAFEFRQALAEPGQFTILGKTYGGSPPSLDHITAALDDLALHPATAQHLSRKLAVHFLGDQPDADLVEAMAARYLETQGDLMAVYEVLLTHEAAWHDRPGNVKRPIDFMASSLRALDLVPRHLPEENNRNLNRWFFAPMLLMGQTFGRPEGPDGWPEADAEWITPQRLAARIQWSMTTPFQIKRLLPDPGEFVEVALGPFATEEVRFAAKSAETRAEGVGLVLASPAFQRT